MLELILFTSFKGLDTAEKNLSDEKMYQNFKCGQKKMYQILNVENVSM